MLPDLPVHVDLVLRLTSPQWLVRFSRFLCLTTLSLTHSVHASLPIQVVLQACTTAFLPVRLTHVHVTSATIQPSPKPTNKQRHGAKQLAAHLLSAPQECHLRGAGRTDQAGNKQSRQQKKSARVPPARKRTSHSGCRPVRHRIGALQKQLTTQDWETTLVATSSSCALLVDVQAVARCCSTW